MTVKNAMTQDPKTIQLDENVSEVIKLLREHGFDHLPVVNEYGSLEGIISKSDLYKKLLSLSQDSSGATYSNKILEGMTTKELMTVDPVSVKEEHSLEYAIELLLQGEFHALPVVNDVKLVGIITSKDLLEYMMDNNDFVL